MMALPKLDDLDNLLASLNQLKPPGASKNKIQTITALSVNNIKVCNGHFWTDSIPHLSRWISKCYPRHSCRKR